MKHPFQSDYNTMLSCLIIEDEPLAAVILEDYIRQTPWLQLAGRCPDAISAMETLHEQSVDVLFLDINLPGIKGLDFLRTLHRAPQVILTTAYEEYAVESYSLNVVDYLLKPIDFERFIKAAQKLAPVSTPATPLRPFRFFNVNKKMVRVWLDEIQYVESLREYVRLGLTAGRSILTKMQISEMEQVLAGVGFLRIQRSFLVSLKHIDAYSVTSLHVGGKLLPIGRQYRAAVQAVLEQY